MPPSDKAKQPRETRSPIKNLPIRQPGQSSRENRDNLFENQFLFPIMFAGTMVVMAMMEWSAALMRRPPMPWVWTVGAVASIALVYWRYRHLYGKFRSLNLGIIGEEAVGQFLEEHLRLVGCQVLHDIPANGFNVDHVVIGPTGVFAIETKTHSKPAKGVSSIKYDGTSVSVNGFKPDRDPVVQAKGQARWLVDLLERSTGRKVFVQPVVLYPGWFVEPGPGNAEVWILNEKALPTFVKNARNPALSNEDVHLLAFHLAQYVIAKGRQL
jgi:hypothetical protein